MTNEDYIKTSRDLLNEDFFKNPAAAHFWQYIRLKAAPKEEVVYFRGKEFHLKPGELITTYRQISKDTGLTLSQVRSAHKTHSQRHTIRTVTTQGYSLIQVLNWTSENQSRTRNAQPATHETHSKTASPNTENLDLFEAFRKAYPGTKRGLQTELKVFKKHKDWKEILPTLSKTLENQITAREQLSVAGEFVPPWKHLSTWLNQRCWEEEATVKDEQNEKLYEVQGKFLTESKYKRMKAAGEIVPGPNGKMTFKYR